jgi:hypothetical protein
LEVEKFMGIGIRGRKSSLPLTPPDSPWVSGLGDGTANGLQKGVAGFGEEMEDLDLNVNLTKRFSAGGQGECGPFGEGLVDRVVILYVGRM